VDRPDKVGETVLILASGKGHLDSVKALLEKGADVYDSNKREDTALISAISMGHLDSDKALLEKWGEPRSSKYRWKGSLDIGELFFFYLVILYCAISALCSLTKTELYADKPSVHHDLICSINRCVICVYVFILLLASNVYFHSNQISLACRHGEACRCRSNSEVM